MSPYEPEQLWEYNRHGEGEFPHRFILIFRVSANPDHEYWRCLAFRGTRRVRDRIMRLPLGSRMLGYERLA